MKERVFLFLLYISRLGLFRMGIWFAFYHSMKVGLLIGRLLREYIYLYLNFYQMNLLMSCNRN